MITEAEYDKTTASLKEMLNAICDYAHDRCVKVMTARAKVNLPRFCHQTEEPALGDVLINSELQV